MKDKILLIGPAGSGKTYRLLEEFESCLKNPRDPFADDFFYVVPSEEHTERIISLIIQRGIKGFFRRRVTTFSRFVSEVFTAGEENTASGVERFLITREIFAKKKWPFFEEVQESPGFINLVLSFITELKESLVSAADFREKVNALKRLEPGLSAKYETLAGVYEAYDLELKKRGVNEKADIFQRYLQGNKGQTILKKRFKKIWLDGFFDFTPLQILYLKELCALSGAITVTLTMDSRPERYDLFETVYGTKKQLTDIGFQPYEIQTKHNIRPKSLSHLERCLFQSAAKGAGRVPGKEIEVFEAIGMEGEIEMIARDILRLCRETNIRYSDFAILFRKIGEYETVIRSIFARYEIPVEIHERGRVKFAPLMRVLVTLLKIFHDGWKREDVIRFLKSGYVKTCGDSAVSHEWVSELEQRAMMAGIAENRERWLEIWPREEKSEKDELFHEAKTRILGCLSEFEERLRKAKNVYEITEILKKGAEETFGIFGREEAGGVWARRDAAGYRRFLALLGEIEKSMAFSETAEIFKAFTERFFRLAEIDLYSCREPDKNRVQVYDVSLGRQKDYRVVYAAGLLEKRFPAAVRENPVLSDWERGLFNGVKGEGRLQERLPRQNMERYLFYLAVTRARERLVLSYPGLDLEGKESLPSYYVEEVKALFKDLKIKRQELGRPYPHLEEAATERELEMAVMGGLWSSRRNKEKDAKMLLYLAKELMREPDARDRFERSFYRVEDALTDPEIQKTGIFKPYVTSATSLEEYGKCPFRYYSHRVLRLFDPEEDKNVMTRGIILHEALENCFKKWQKTPAIFDRPQTAIREALTELQESFKRHRFVSEKKYQIDLEYEDLGNILTRFLEFEMTRLKESPLKPRYFEFGFGDEKRESPALRVEDGANEIMIRGKIDRIDIDEKSGSAAVIDYKRSAVFEKGALEFGTSLQLPIYVMAAEKFLSMKVISAELYSLREKNKSKKKKGFYREEAVSFFPGMSEKRMLLDEKAFASLMERSRVYIRKYSRGMAGMKIPVKPRLCESYCSYASVCRIEKWRLSFIAEAIEKEDSEDKELCAHPFDRGDAHA